MSGNCDDREVTSLAEEFPKEPDSEKDTYGESEESQKDVLKRQDFVLFTVRGPVLVPGQSEKTRLQNKIRQHVIDLKRNVSRAPEGCGND